jgi:lipopolysaccharide export system protein LptA
MRWTIERLRLGIVALAVLLLVTIAGSFLYGRWRLRQIAQDLPARLGIQIQQSTQGFVLSKTEKGRPLFTLHAARAVEFKSGGHVSLHDVEIDLYNQRNGVADTIAGSDFEYDPHSQVVQAKGEAHIVLHAPANDGHGGLGAKEAGQTLRVTTHGLTFHQKTGMASCSGEVDFSVADSSGQAVGAEFDSKQGHLVLVSQVVFTTKMQDHPAVLRAARAIYDRNANQVNVLQPRYTSGTERGSAETATVLLRSNGSAERLDAGGGVRLSSDGDMRVKAPTMQVAFNANNQPQQAHFSGGVEFSGDRTGEKVFGSARETTIDFDADGRAQRATLDETVQLDQEANGLRRTLAAEHLILNLLPSKTGNVQLQSANAAGDAVFTSVSTTAGHAPQQTTGGGQTLNAKFSAGNQLRQLDGAGQTLLKTVSANGDINTSSGDALQIDFSPTRGTSGVISKNTTESIQTAVQTGHVILRQVGGGKKRAVAGAQIFAATAKRASYVAATDTLTLTGEPEFHDAQMEMTADRMEVKRATGKLISTGGVQVTVLADNARQNAGARAGAAGALLSGKQPVHIIAEQATVFQDMQIAIFSRRARLWQGGDTVEAPVIELSQKMQTLTAYGDSGCADCVVSSFSGQSNPAAQSSNLRQAKQIAPTTFRIRSQRLVYSDAERMASFLRNVQVLSSSGVLFADDAEVLLSPANRSDKEKKSAADRNNGASSSVERIIAAGDVRLQQPGRTATGTRLVYTAADGHFVLTGNETNPPQVIDVDRGTVTGQVLTFAAREQAIMVSGTDSHTATTKTRVQKR